MNSSEDLKDKIVLICATGRSGSTTLLRILNTIPNSNICGENFGAIHSLLNFYLKLHIACKTIPGNYNPISYEKLIEKNIKPSWYNSFDIKQIENRIRETIISMFKKEETTKLWGFKEIRYDNNKIKFLKYFKTLFPQTKIIIQVRENIMKQINSGWFKNDKIKSYKFITNMNKELLDFYNENKSWCYFTTFERMFDKKNLQNIFKFIDCENDFNEKQITDILNNNIKD